MSAVTKRVMTLTRERLAAGETSAPFPAASLPPAQGDHAPNR